jgi:hypothetical protein
MTLGTQTILTERLSRTAGANTVTTASDITKQYINEGVREFAKKVHGIDQQAFVKLSPKFDIGTDFAVKFTIGGNVNTYGSGVIPMVSAAINDATPTTLMGHFVSNVNAAMGSMTISMAWSASTWTFKMFGPASATSVAIASPTGVGYTDGVSSMFGSAFAGTGSSYTFAMPQDCNLETSLPSGFLEMNWAYYGDTTLRKAPYDVFIRPQVSGTPQFYGIRNKQVVLYPTPVQQDYFKIFYAGIPSDLDTSGSDDSVECPLPTENHMAPVYYAASKLLEEGHEYQKSVYNLQLFMGMCADYRMRNSNNNPSLFPERTPSIPYRVGQ